jgi:acetyltransferase-like isoleucine patch superfamily enzyme
MDSGAKRARPSTEHPTGSSASSARVDASRAGVMTRIFGEARDAVAMIEPSRLAWDGLRALPDFSVPTGRARFLRLLGCDIERGVGVLGHVSIVGPRGCGKNLRVATGSIIGPNAVFGLDAPITLGRGVSIGPRVVLHTATHALGRSAQRMRPEVQAKPIVIEDGAWIAIGAMVLAGVRIGCGAVVAAGSVITSDVPANAFVAGNPAAIVEMLPGR